MGKGELIKITRRQDGQLRDLSSGLEHAIQVKTRYKCHLIEVEDTHFHLNSAVLLPDYGPQVEKTEDSPDNNSITGLAIIAACFLQARNNPEQKALVVGHTDTSGSDEMNQLLSEQRAENVLAALKGEKGPWAEIAFRRHTVEDYQQVLRWITIQLGWNCHPGEKDGKLGAKTRAAILAFQKQYNVRNSRSIQEDGVIGRETWEAFFDIYQQELKYILGSDENGVTKARSGLKFLDCVSIGCGEKYPIIPSRKNNYRNPEDRRVEILFFDPGEEPIIDCSKSAVACVELFEKKVYQVTPVSVEPLPPPAGVTIHVTMELAYKDPDPSVAAHKFPEKFPVTVDYEIGDSVELFVGKDGILDFQAPRANRAFTLCFKFSKTFYIASPPADTAQPDGLVEEANLEKYLQDNATHRVFKLPREWKLKHADWDVSGSTTFDKQKGQFSQLQDRSVATIGSDATPVSVILDPKWQYVRIDYFDRQYGHDHHDHKRVSIPPVVIDGFQESPRDGKTPLPDTRSNWIIRADDLEKTCFCIPWIIQCDVKTDANKPKPDKKIELQFRTPAASFISSENKTTRRIEIITDADKLKPGPDRLSLYDLPVLWKSKKYFTRCTGGGSAPFEELTEAKIKDSLNPDKLLSFSLDDIILTARDGTTGSVLKTVKISADSQVTIFFHQFRAPTPAIPGVSLSDQGVYKPGVDASEKYFPYSDIDMPVRSYISDYPGWTRMVLAEGNVFDVFGERTTDIKNHNVVGARAAVRWVDSVASGIAPGSQLDPRPGRTDESFMSIQPFFCQDMYRTVARDLGAGEYKEWESPVAAFPGWVIGRFDMVLLRCCDTRSGNEVALNFQYFRFHLDFAKAPASIKSTQDKKNLYKTNMLQNIPKRWNGPDRASNSGKFSYAPQAADGPKIEVHPFWFAQETPEPRSHFRLNIISISRANMNGATGIGNFSTGDDEATDSGWFTAAHEAGHGGSLPDEYNERWSSNACSYEFNGVGCNVPGDPYALVSGPLMMEGVSQIHARYFWHAAEWTRLVTGVPLNVLEVRAGSTKKYKLRVHPSTPNRTFTHFPLLVKSNSEVSKRGKFDAYLYQLGDDPYASAIRAGKAFDGILIVVVKVRIAFPDATAHDHVVGALNSIIAQIDGKFNKFETKGDIADVHFDHCAIQFSIRFLVETLVIDLADADNTSYLQGLGYTVTEASGKTPASTTATQADYTRKVNAIDDVLRHPRHYKVTVGKNAATGWKSQTELNIGLDVTTAARGNLGNIFWPYFGDMIGFRSSEAKPAVDPAKANVETRVAKIMLPGATVS